MTEGPLKAPDLASRLLHFIAKASASQNDALSLMGELSAAKTGPKLVFYNGLEHLLSLVPDELFADMEMRLNQKAVLRKVNERLVAVEEEEYKRQFKKKSEMNTSRRGSD